MDRREPPALEALALELLELKSAAYVDHGLVRGGAVSLRALHGFLERSDALDDGERARFADVTRTLTDAGVLERTVPARAKLGELTLDGFGITAPSPPPPDEEGEVLAALSERVWLGELAHLYARRALGWWAERERITARLVASTLRSLEAEMEGRARPERLADIDDPLVSFGDPGAVVALAQELIDAIARLGAVRPARRSPLAVVRDAMLAIARNPHAGAEVRSVFGPGAAAWQVAIEEIEKERLPDAERAVQRRALELRRDEALADEERARALLRADVARYVAAATDLLADLERHLPVDLGGTVPAFALTHALHAHAAERRRDVVPATATTVTAHLNGPVRFVLQGMPIAMLGAPGAETLYLDRAPWPLRDGVVIDALARVRVYRVASYVHLRWYPPLPDTAAALAEALLQAHLLTHDRHATLSAVVAEIVGDALGSTADRVARWVAHGRALAADHPADPDAVHARLTTAWNVAAHALSAHIPPHVAAGVVDRWFGCVLPTSEPPLEPGARAATVDLAAPSTALDLGPLPLDVAPAPAGHEGWLIALPGRVLGVAAPTLVAAAREGVVVAAVAQARVAVVLLPARALRAPRGRA